MNVDLTALLAPYTVTSLPDMSRPRQLTIAEMRQARIDRRLAPYTLHVERVLAA